MFAALCWGCLVTSEGGLLLGFVILAASLTSYWRREIFAHDTACRLATIGRLLAACTIYGFLLLAHLVINTLWNALVLLSGFGWTTFWAFLVLVNRRTLVVLLSRCSVGVFNHVSALLATINCHIDRGMHDNFFISVFYFVWLYSYFDRDPITFICDFTAVTTFFLSFLNLFRTSLMFLSWWTWLFLSLSFLFLLFFFILFQWIVKIWLMNILMASSSMDLRWKASAMLSFDPGLDIRLIDYWLDKRVLYNRDLYCTILSLTRLALGFERSRINVTIRFTLSFTWSKWNCRNGRNRRDFSVGFLIAVTLFNSKSPFL